MNILLPSSPIEIKLNPPPPFPLPLKNEYPEFLEYF